MPASWPLKTSVDRVDPCRVIIADATHSLTTSLVSFRVPGTHRRQLRHRLLAPVNRFSTTSRSSSPNNLLPPHFPQFLLYNRQRHSRCIEALLFHLKPTTMGLFSHWRTLPRTRSGGCANDWTVSVASTGETALGLNRAAKQRVSRFALGDEALSADGTHTTSTSAAQWIFYWKVVAD